MTLFDLISQGWTLLLFPSKDAMPETIDSLQRIARQAQEAVGEAVHSYVVLDAIAKDDTGVTTLLDPSHEVSRLFAANRGLVALVRPDGYLGYRGRPDQPGELASYLARVFAMQLREAQTDSAGLTERMDKRVPDHIRSLSQLQSRLPLVAFAIFAFFATFACSSGGSDRSEPHPVPSGLFAVAC